MFGGAVVLGTKAKVVFGGRPERQAFQRSEERMDVDWPLAGFIAVGLLVATLASRLLVHIVQISHRAVRALALDRNRREPCAGLIQVTFHVDERSLP
jgi:hypothetical protein